MLLFALSAVLAGCRGGSPSSEGAGKVGAPAAGEADVEAPGKAPMSASGVELSKEVAPGRTWVIRALSCRAEKAGLRAGTLELEAPRVTGMSDGREITTLAAGSGRYEEGAVSCIGGATFRTKGWSVEAPEMRWSGVEDRVDTAGPTTLSYGMSRLTGEGARAAISAETGELLNLKLGGGSGRLSLADLETLLAGGGAELGGKQ